MSIEQIADLAGHTDRAWHLSWSPSVPLLASCSSDKSVRLYSYAPTPSHSDPTSSEPTSAPAKYSFAYSSSIPTSHQRTVRSLAFSPTGTTLATASFDSTVGIWQQIEEAGVEDGPAQGASTGEWESVDPLEGHESECKSAEWSFDGRLLASCSRDKSVWIWEAVGPAEFECLAVLMEHSQDVKCVAWHPSEELLASASYDDTIKLYAADPYDDEWSCIATLSSHTATVWTIAFSPCGNYLVSAGDDLVIKVWGREEQGKARELGELGEAKREEGGRMGPWSAGGVRIGAKERWSWSEVGQIEGAHTRTIYSLDWKKGGVKQSEGGLGRIVSCGGDGTINVFQITRSTSAESPCPGHTLVSSIEDAHGVSDVNAVSWCNIAPKLAARKLRDLQGDASEPEEAMEEGDEKVDKKAEDPKWAASDDMFASAGDDGIVRVWMVRP